jgi:hypothetical protein
MPSDGSAGAGNKQSVTSPQFPIASQTQLGGKTMPETTSLGALASRFIETESVPWIEMSPGNKMKVIYHDPISDMLTIVSKLEPGAGIPAHVHEDLEQTFVLEGFTARRRRRMHRRQFRRPRQGQPSRADSAQRLHDAGVLPQAHGAAEEGFAQTRLS